MLSVCSQYASQDTKTAENMPDIIQLLPDAVANQIAAGEVIQRPASVIKELVENAVDAKATEVKIVVKDAGKTLIQVIDNGKGMSDTDARMAFERHATSKINNAEDLFNLHTKGFRGEALASIAAIAHVELKSKQQGADLGSRLLIEGSKVIVQEPTSCPEGSNFSIKNLFYNTPARRKFLKGDSTEFRHIVTEVQRVALAHPSIYFRLIHNDSEIYNLPVGNLRQRVVGVFGKNINKELVSLKTKTSIAKIEGFIGKPDMAKKRSGDQYLFVNDRFFKSGYFHRAIMNAYDGIIAPGMHPTYFIFFDVNPTEIDVNIHPTKTEIKFTDGAAIFQILEVVAKESLGKFNIAPSLDFGAPGLIDIPPATPTPKEELPQPHITHNEAYNPFNTGGNLNSGYASTPKTTARENSNQDNWAELYAAFEQEHQETPDEEINFSGTPQEQDQEFMFLESSAKHEETPAGRKVYQFKLKYILTTVKSGLMLIDQKRAHERILYEMFLLAMDNEHGVMQQTLFPKQFQLPADDAELLREIHEDLRLVGFDISELSQNSFMIQGTPADLGDIDGEDLIQHLLEYYKKSEKDVKLRLKEKVALSLAKTSCIGYGRKLTDEEMQGIVDSLFACQMPNFAPDGKTAITIMETAEIDRLFK